MLRWAPLLISVIGACGSPDTTAPFAVADAGALATVDAAALRPVVPPLPADAGAADAGAPNAATVSCAGYIALPGVAGCAFYACREAQHPCGTSGYYLGYGEKYCERFLLVDRPVLSPAGQAFLDAGRDCLMHVIDATIAVDLECAQVRTEATVSHVACYRDNGFCQLPLSDKLTLFASVDRADRDLVKMFETQLTCF